MFKSKSTETFAETKNNTTSLIGAGTTLKGDITCNADLRIDGQLYGNITSTAKVVIGANGVVEGNITGQQADIHGKVVGIIKVKDLLQLKSSCTINGNIYVGKLQIEPAAIFNGECHMTAANVVEMNNSNNSNAQQPSIAAPLAKTANK